MTRRDRNIKHNQDDKQHHHGCGAARPSGDVDLMNPVGGLPHIFSEGVNEQFTLIHKTNVDIS